MENRRDTKAGTPVRLAPGHHIYAVPGGEWRCYAPGDRFIRLRGPAARMRVVQQVLSGALDAHGISGDPAEVHAVSRMLETFETEGLTERPTADTAGIRRDRVVHIAGDNPIARLMQTLLEDHVSVTRGTIDENAVAQSDFVVACAEWLPDAFWQRVDSWCAVRDVPWHMCYAEGSQFYLGPCSIPGRTASYTDTRSRRLAAAGNPDELLLYWAYLDAGHELPPVPWPSTGGVATIAGLLANDALAYLAQRPVPSEGFQLAFDASSATIQRHPVLPLPALLSLA